MPRPRQGRPRSTPPAALEFFAGMGLVRRALEAAPPESRWRTRWASDHDPLKQRLYAAAFPGAARILDPRDIRAVPAADLPDAELWTASFPCTDLSVAGRGAGIHAGESGAVWALLELLAAIEDGRRPRWLLFENVVGLLTSHAGADLRALVRAVNDLGYAVDPMLVDARRFTPQSRPRIYLIAARLDEPSTILRDPAALEPCVARPARLLRAMRALDDLLWCPADLPMLPSSTARLSGVVERLAEDDPRWWPPDRVDYFLAQVHPNHRAAIARLRDAERLQWAAAFRRVRTVGGAKRSLAEIRTDGLAGCLRTPKGGSAKQILVEAGRGELRVRHLTALECARLQGADALPGGFSEHELLFALGDAVCVPAARWALDRIVDRRAARAGPPPLTLLGRPPALAGSR